MAGVTLDEVRAAKAKVLRQLKGIAQVVGVGITRVDGVYAVKVNLSEAGVDLPTQIDGVPLRVEVTGPIRAR